MGSAILVYFYMGRSRQQLCPRAFFFLRSSLNSRRDCVVRSFCSREPVTFTGMWSLCRSWWSVIWSMSIISFMKGQFVVTQEIVKHNLHYKHTACQNAVSIKKWFVYSSSLSVALLRIVEVFSVKLCIGKLWQIAVSRALSGCTVPNPLPSEMILILMFIDSVISRNVH